MMRFRRRMHSVPQLNTTSTADISFMLLIFFLVTTSMDSDKGLSRRLPPADKTERQEETTVDQGALLRLQITADGRVLVDGKPVEATELRHRINVFIERVGRKHLISVDCDPHARYDTYFFLQNEMTAAYRIWRERVARKRYGRSYDGLSPAQRDEVNALCPQRIAEQYHGMPDHRKGGMS